MTLFALAVVLLAGCVGPVLAWGRTTKTPLVVGEILIGLVLGTTGFRVVHADSAILTYLATAGFALVMLVAGTQVPLRDANLRPALRRGAGNAVLVGALSVPAAFVLAALTDVHQVPLFAVLMASSSAALVIPVIHGAGLGGPEVLPVLAQVAIADVACIVALPLAVDPHHAVRAAVGAVVVVATAIAAFAVLLLLERRGVLRKVHERSVARNFGLELRLSLFLLFVLAGLAEHLHVTVMIAGFACGLALSSIGEPRRLAGQLFAVTEGFLGPVFFVWLGASLDLRALFSHPRMLVLLAGLTIGALAVHLATGVLRTPLNLALLAAAQLGVPISAVTIGEHGHLLRPGEGGAILGAALITVATTAIAAARASSAAPTATQPNRKRDEQAVNKPT